MKLNFTVGFQDRLKDDVLRILDEFNIPLNVLKAIKSLDETTRATKSVLDNGSPIEVLVTGDASMLFETHVLKSVKSSPLRLFGSKRICQTLGLIN